MYVCMYSYRVCAGHFLVVQITKGAIRRVRVQKLNKAEPARYAEWDDYTHTHTHTHYFPHPGVRATQRFDTETM